MAPSGFVSCHLALSRSTRSIIHRLAISELQLVIPTNKDEFEQAGHWIRIAFRPKGDETVKFLTDTIKEDFQRYGIFEIMLMAHSGNSNNLSCVYKAMILNESTPEIYIQSLSDGMYELGLDAHGNLFDALLFSEELFQRAGPPRDSR